MPNTDLTWTSCFILNIFYNFMQGFQLLYNLFTSLLQNSMVYRVSLLSLMDFPVLVMEVYRALRKGRKVFSVWVYISVYVYALGCNVF